VLDTGADLDHPDLQANIVAGYDFVNGDNDPDDDHGHGTHVSGIAVGNKPDGGLKGVAPGAGLIAVQVFSYFEDYGEALSWSSDQLKALEYVYSLRTTYSIASVNMSLGGGYYEEYCDGNILKPVIDHLRAAGIAVAIAGGNEAHCGAISTPGCISSAITVGASDSHDQAAVFSNWQPTMQDVFAPGVSIVSAVSTGDNDYETLSGTSMATPHVAGAWAVFRQAAPTAEVSEIEAVMETAGIPVAGSCDTEPATGPRLDVDAVVDHFLDLVAVPTADAGPDQGADEGVEFALDGSNSVSNSGNGLTYLWEQTDGSEVALSDTTAAKPVFTTPAADLEGEQLTFDLTVRDAGNDLTDTDTVVISVSDVDYDRPPTADAGSDQSVDTGITVTLDGTGAVSNSNTGMGLSHAWLQTAGEEVTLSDPRSVSPYFVSPAVDGASELTFELIVVDGYNNRSGSDDVLITVTHIDNDVDPDFLPVRAWDGQIVGMKTRYGDLISITPLSLADFENAEGQPDFLEHLFAVEVKCAEGATVAVMCQYPDAAPADAGWFMYDTDDGWDAFSVGATDNRTVLTADLTDGGAGDQDGSVNGVIVTSFGLGYNQSESVERSSGGGGCMISGILDWQ
jgi:subtilisin family serine protease